MNGGVVHGFEHVVLQVVWGGLALAVSVAAAVVAQRIALALQEVRGRRIALRYGPIIDHAMAGDPARIRVLAESPSRHRLALARLIVGPLILDRTPERILAARMIFRALAMKPMIDRYLRSRWWWRRVLALRGLGLIQEKDGASAIVSALDDPNPAVRNAALDALADLQNPDTLPAIVVRLHDATVQRGRVLAALEAFGSAGEPFLLELAKVDAEHRLNYARALALCGTERARAVLCQWTEDDRAEVRAAAFRALAHVGLDQETAARAVAALENGDAGVRAMAAEALHGWTGTSDAASHLARHLDDSWNVAVHAARTLQSMPAAGRAELEACAARPDLAGLLARQMLWEAQGQW